MPNTIQILQYVALRIQLIRPQLIKTKDSKKGLPITFLIIKNSLPSA